MPTKTSSQLTLHDKLSRLSPMQAKKLLGEAAAALTPKAGREDVKFDLWMPEDIGTARGIVVISGHGSGETLFNHAELRKIARELHLAIFKFVGNPMQRGFWPRSLLDERITFFAGNLSIPNSITRRSFSTATQTAPDSPPSILPSKAHASGPGSPCAPELLSKCISPKPRKLPA